MSSAVFLPIVTYFVKRVDNLRHDAIISLVMNMSVVNNVLKILEDKRGEFVSGNEISKKLFVSRNSVWKAVNALKSQGYDIISITNKGYCLSACNDIISPQSVEKYLDRDLKVSVYDELDSTNNYLKKLASDGEREGRVIIARSQSNGKGRMGKSFYSPEGSGVYFSVLLRPDVPAEKALFLTVMAAVAVAETAMKYTDGEISVKWVNDVYRDGKKICGILTEGSLSLETGGLDYAVLGIGINILTPNNGFPEDIKNRAGAVFDENRVPNDIKSKILAEILNRFFRMYSGEDTDYIERYKKYSFLTGKKIDVIYSDRTEPAFVLGITDDCHLVIKSENGEVKTLSSGDVSVRV